MAARRGVWALARFLHRNQLPGEKEKNALANCRPRSLVPKRHMLSAYVLLRKHCFPPRLHWDPTVHKSVPKPTDPRASTRQPQASWMV